MSRTRPIFRVGLGVALALALVAAVNAAPGWFQELAVFDARRFDVRGIAYLTEGQVLRAAGIGPGASLWEDPEPWVQRLQRHPLVERAEVRRRFPATLVVEVEERQPVGLVPNPTLVPVDGEGRYLPLDPSRFPLDYPILRPVWTGEGREGRPPSIRIRPLAQAAVILRREAEFWREVSEIRIDHHGTVEVRWGDPEVLFQFPPRLEEYRIRKAMTALRHAEGRAGGRRLIRVDQRFGDHVTLGWDREAAQ